MTGGDEESSDEALAQRVQEGDAEALERLVRRYVRPVSAVVASFLSDPDAIEDVAQDTFVRALGAIDRYDTGRPFAPWLYQIARNVARNHRAAASVRHSEALPGEGPASSAPTPDVDAERSELRARLEEEIRKLPEQRRTAFRLTDVDGMTAEEVARLMGLSAGTVRSHVHHARRQLREALTGHAGISKDNGG